jgi:hypothetical protein
MISITWLISTQLEIPALPSPESTDSFVHREVLYAAHVPTGVSLGLDPLLQ